MIRKILPVSALLAVLLCLMGGCTKTNPVVFSWDYQGVHFVADSSYATSASGTSQSTIDAFSGLTLLGILTGASLAVGTYTFHEANNSGQPYMFYNYVATEFSQTGILTITYNDTKKISGSFSVTYTDGTTMTGSFTDIPIRQ